MYGQIDKRATRRCRARSRRRVHVGLLLALLLALLHSSVAPSPAGATPEARAWQPGPVYQQIGPSCVGYSLAAWLDAEPSPVRDHPSGLKIYQAAQELDGAPLPHHGSSVVAGIKALAQMGYVRDWTMTRDAEVALAFLRTDGPIVIESDFPREVPVIDNEQNLVWTGRMMRHGWLCYGVDEHDRLGCQNSGSVYWNEAEDGRFHMTRDALDDVLEHGRAWLIHKAAAGARPDTTSTWIGSRSNTPVALENAWKK
jgi:hypothetical protein